MPAGHAKLVRTHTVGAVADWAADWAQNSGAFDFDAHPSYLVLKSRAHATSLFARKWCDTHDLGVAWVLSQLYCVGAVATSHNSGPLIEGLERVGLRALGLSALRAECVRGFGTQAGLSAVLSCRHDKRRAACVVWKAIQPRIRPQSTSVGRVRQTPGSQAGHVHRPRMRGHLHVRGNLGTWVLLRTRRQREFDAGIGCAVLGGKGKGLKDAPCEGTRCSKRLTGGGCSRWSQDSAHTAALAGYLRLAVEHVHTPALPCYTHRNTREYTGCCVRAACSWRRSFCGVVASTSSVRCTHTDVVPGTRPLPKSTSSANM
ncbi:hypothetical protein B0H17DRAFT_1137954 [Mycena rosella]|uniref:Uncharacterized protein n=1 Tax=Mycena rosella TaxID=1033263 RepID=A0AAD7D7M9_MYCRO|nr:hypothetical protein B0H17DRAFT_1137954 [Mycena rosella]